MAQIEATINGSAHTADNGNFVSMLDQLDEDAKSEGNFYKPAIGKINQVVVITDPIRGMTNYTTTTKQQVQWQMFIAETQAGKFGDPKVWGIKAKSAQTQLAAIIRANRMFDQKGDIKMVGSVLQVVAAQKLGNNGKTFMEYTLLLVSPPTPQIAAQLASQYPSERLKEVGPQLFEQMTTGKVPVGAP